MAIEYKTIDVSTVKGIRRAELLHMSGWQTIQVGLFRVQFSRRRPSKRLTRKESN